ncbi:MAG: hypothetical protein GY787_16225 [Alteromonadales bacterium]|nr:hypothetical protein [Alteromonadales bacterium]
MLTIIVADIFGNSPALQQLAKQLSKQDVLIVDAYAGQKMDFRNEQTAYDYFSQNIGLATYAQQLKEKLSALKQPFNIIAFSVGGSAIWLNCEWLNSTQVNRVICFYASQIRHHINLQPAIPIQLVLPKYEQHFDIQELKKVLVTKKNVTIKHSDYLHGFMNQLSTNFSPVAYQQWLKEI